MLGRSIFTLALTVGMALGSLGAAQARQFRSSNPAASPVDSLAAEAQGWLTDLVRINTSTAATASASSAPASAASSSASAPAGSVSVVLNSGDSNGAQATAAPGNSPSPAAVPDGNEAAAAKYVAQILQKESIPTEILEVAPGQDAVIARMQAGPLANPATALLLVAHLDVAGVDRRQWTVDPFAGTVKDGYIYGRGVLDDKGMLAANLAIMVALKRSGARLNRDVIFLADGGSEPGNPAGIKVLANRFWDKIACGFALNEGGDVVLQGAKVQYVGVQAGEKVPYDVVVTASGTPGPASIPRPDDAVTHLAAAIAKIGAIETQPQLMTLTRRYFEQLSQIEEEDTAKWMRALETERFSLAVLRIEEMSPLWGAMLHDTIAPIEIEASAGSAAVPPEARADLHVQVLPGNPISSLVALMEKTVNDPKIKFQIDSDYGVAAPESSLDSPLYQTIARDAPQQFPGAAVVPMLSPEATGSAELRLRNVQAYGLLPFPLTEADNLRREGDDERLALSSFRTGLEFLYRTVYDFAANK